MDYYNIFDEEMIFKNIKLLKILIFLFLLCCCTLFILSFIVNELLYILGVFFFVSIILAITYLTNKKKYELKIAIINDYINVYNFKGKLLRSFYLSNMQTTINSVLFFKSISRIDKSDCFILYSGVVLENEIEYSEYYKDKRVLIVQKPAVINMLQQIIGQ